MSVVEPSSPRNTGHISGSEGTQMEAQAGGDQCPSIMDLVIKFQALSMDEPPVEPNAEPQVEPQVEAQVEPPVEPLVEPNPEANSKTEAEVAAKEAEVAEVATEAAVPAAVPVPEIIVPELAPAVLDNVRDGNFFLKLVHDEQARLSALAELAEKHTAALANNGSISEDVLGMLRAASGSARLLVKSKMNQFEGLCKSNLNPSPANKFPTTADDLEGFWDMVCLQVSQLDASFADIEKLKANNWQRPDDEPSTSTRQSGARRTKAKPGPSKTSQTSLAPLATEEQRKRTAERRLALVKARQAARN